MYIIIHGIEFFSKVEVLWVELLYV